MMQPRTPTNLPWRKFTFHLLLLCTCCLLALVSAGQITGASAHTQPVGRSRSTLTPTPTLKPVPKPKPNPIPTLPPLAAPPSLANLQMFSATTGWSLTDDGQKILHTTRGVAHWSNVTPAQQTNGYHFSAPDFLNERTVWLALQDANQHLSILHTTNGGQSWQATPVGEGTEMVQISFIDASTGWALLGTSAGMSQEAVTVLHSTDGGATWKSISSTNLITGDRPGLLPLSGAKTGMSFVNATTGWVTGTTANAKFFLYLYVTHDGGYSWQPESLSLPTTALSAQATPPVFFNARDGYLPVTVQENTGLGLYVFLTSDAGGTWQPTTPVPSATLSVTFSDLEHGWTFDQKNLLHVTSNGGKTWSTVVPQVAITLQNPGNLSFVSRTVGWLLYAGLTRNYVLETENGGKTWTIVNFTIG